MRQRFPPLRNKRHDRSADAKIGARLIIAACGAIGVAPSTGFARGKAYAKTIPKHAAAMAAIQVLGWSYARASDSTGTSKTCLFRQSHVHSTMNDRYADALAAARRAAVAIAEEGAPDDRTIAAEALARRAAEVGISAVDAALRPTQVAARVRWRTIADLHGQGMTGMQIAAAMGINISTVSRVTCGRYDINKPDGRRHNRPPLRTASTEATSASAC